MTRTSYVAFRGSIADLEAQAPTGEARGSGFTQFFALTEEEQKLHRDHAADLVREELARMAVEHKARPVDPRSALDYRGYNTCRLDCVVAVSHPSRSASLELSRDGGWPRAYINPSKIILQPESQGPFVVFLIGKSLSKWVREKQEVNLLGTPPDLTGDFTDAERARWKELIATTRHINCKITSAGRRAAPTGTRNTYA